MDPLSAFGLAGTIVQFVEFGSRIIGNAQYRPEDGSLPENNDPSAVAQSLHAFNPRIKFSVASPSSTSVQLLLDLYDGCDTVCQQLVEDLAKLEEHQNFEKRTKWENIRQSQQSKRMRHELSVLQQLIKVSVAQAIQHHQRLRYQNAEIHTRDKITKTNSPLNRTENARNISHNKTSKHHLSRPQFLYRSSYRTTFFDVEIETIKEPDDRKRTMLNIRSRFPMCKSCLIFQIAQSALALASSYSFGVELGTYNTVPQNSQVFQAAHNLDLRQIQCLFDFGMASPYDRNEYSWSILDEVLCGLALSSMKLPVAAGILLAKRAVEIVELLICCAASDHNMEWVRYLTSFHLRSPHPYMDAELARALRLVLRHSPEDPIQGTNIQFCMHLKDEDNPIFQVLEQQDYWMIDLNCHPCGMYVENDRKMLKDPAGLQAKEALRQGQPYLFIPSHKNPNNFSLDHIEEPLRGLLCSYKSSRRDDVRECCKNRILITLRYGFKPTQLGRDLEEVLTSVLVSGGWSLADVRELLVGDMYDGFTQVIDGDFLYVEETSYVSRSRSSYARRRYERREDTLRQENQQLPYNGHHREETPHSMDVDKFERLPVLIKSAADRMCHGSTFDPTEAFLAPDLFIQNPSQYFNNINSLQGRIFDIGEKALYSVEKRGDIYVLPLPSTGESSSEGDQNLDRLRLLISRNLFMATSITESLLILDTEEFCESTYNVIVADPERPNVLRVVPINRTTLEILKDLLQEAASCCTDTVEWLLLGQALDDLEEALDLVLHHLGLDSSSPKQTHSPTEDNYIRICCLTSSTLSILFLGLVSFVASHICAPDTGLNRDIFTQMQIESVGGSIEMRPRRLKCLDAFIQHPVWTFGESFEGPSVPNREIVDGYYLSVFLADFANLWGPLDLQFVDDCETQVSVVSTRGGIIGATSVYDQTFPQILEETLCHWYGWVGFKSQDLNRELGPISTTKRMLIGAGKDVPIPQNLSLRVSKHCECGRKNQYCDDFPPFELQTMIPSWKVEQRTAQVSAGSYVQILYGHTWKFNAGWTLKDVIVEDWVENNNRDVNHTPRPFYLDYLVVLDISRCSGHARRISIWSLLRQQGARNYLSGFLDPKMCLDFGVLVDFFPTDATFTEVWNSLTSEGKSVVKLAAKEILGTLRSTGVGEDGHLQAWDMTSCNRLDGRKLKPHWRSMVKDDLACASFAIITNSCIRYAASEFHLKSDSLRPAHNPYTILSTRICITAHYSLTNGESFIKKVKPDCGGIDEGRPSWALSNKDFQRWKVPLPDPENELSRRNLSRRALMESARDLSSPDPQALKRIKDRQLSRITWRQMNVTKAPHEIHGASMQNVENNGATSVTTDNEPWREPHGQQWRNSEDEVRNKDSGLDHPVSGVSLDFKNGKGKDIGKLILESHQGSNANIDIRTVSEDSTLLARWEVHKPGLVAEIKAKGEVYDRKIMEWTKTGRKGILPWMITRFAKMEDPTPFVVEHIRGGELHARQKVFQAYIR